MALQSYPSLPSQGYSVFRSLNWGTRLTIAESALERRQADQLVPISEWTLKYDFLREQSDTRGSGGGTGGGFLELSTLMGFYLQQNGPQIPFVFNDPTDNTVSRGLLGISDGVKVAYQLVRQLGSLAGVSPYFIPPYFEPIQTPIAVATVYFDNTPIGVGGWTLEAGGFIKLSAPASNGVAVSADFTFGWLVRFSDARMDLENFMYQLWSAQRVKFRQCLQNILPT